MIADISVYQGDINWDIARKQIELAIFRASIELNPDKKYIQNATNCKIPYGVYHFLKAANADEAAKEAEFFYKTATSNNCKPLFFVADIEYKTQNSSNIESIAKAFAETLFKCGAQKIGVYIGQYNYPYLREAVKLYNFIWIPRYGLNDGTANLKYQPIYPCDLWQYTSVGHIDGIAGNVDLNVLHSSKTLEWFCKEEKKVTFNLVSKVIRSGATGTNVKEIQKALNYLGFSCGTADGIYGTKTKATIIKFQKQYKLVVDGIYGPKTCAKMKELIG